MRAVVTGQVRRLHRARRLTAPIRVGRVDAALLGDRAALLGLRGVFHDALLSWLLLKLGSDVVIDVLSVEVEEVRTIEAAHLDGLAATVGKAAWYPALLSLDALLPELDLRRRNWFCFCSRLQSMQANSRFSHVHASHQYTDFGR